MIVSIKLLKSLRPKNIFLVYFNINSKCVAIFEESFDKEFLLLLSRSTSNSDLTDGEESLTDGEEDVLCQAGYIYILVEFTARGRPSIQKSIEIVPLKWIFYCDKSKIIVTKFLKPTVPLKNNKFGYDQDDCDLLEDFIKQNVDAPACNDTWPLYPCKYKGRASEYNYNTTAMFFIFFLIFKYLY